MRFVVGYREVLKLGVGVFSRPSKFGFLKQRRLFFLDWQKNTKAICFKDSKVKIVRKTPYRYKIMYDDETHCLLMVRTGKIIGKPFKLGFVPETRMNYKNRLSFVVGKTKKFI